MAELHRSGTAVWPLVAVLLAILPVPSVGGQEAGSLAVRRATDQADVVLVLLAKRQRGEAITEDDWRVLTATEGYRRLKERDEAFGVEDFDASFRAFLLSDELLARREALAEAVRAWATIDLGTAAGLALAYLPPGTRLAATLYPVIKPRGNSFVYDLDGDPAIFFYVDPQQPTAELHNHLAHELHHIGFGTGCADPPGADDLAQGPRAALRWLGGFGEGLATLAAAGGPHVHPHATSSPRAWAVWERDVTRLDEDLRRVESFLLAVARGQLDPEAQRQGFLDLIRGPGVPQGPFYTVGWKMAALVETIQGRAALVAGICDPRNLLAGYNRVVRGLEADGDEGPSWPRWSEDLLRILSTPTPAASPIKP